MLESLLWVHCRSAPRRRRPCLRVFSPSSTCGSRHFRNGGACGDMQGAELVAHRSGPITRFQEEPLTRASVSRLPFLPRSWLLPPVGTSLSSPYLQPRHGLGSQHHSRPPPPGAPTGSLYGELFGPTHPPGFSLSLSPRGFRSALTSSTLYGQSRQPLPGAQPQSPPSPLPTHFLARSWQTPDPG